MKDIINFFKNTFLNNKGKMSAGAITGLGVGVAAALFGYGVYNAYNTTPTYNPANRAAYNSEAPDFAADSFSGSGLYFQTSGSLPPGGEVYSASALSGSGSERNKATKEQANFEAARAYLNSPKAGQAGSAPGTNGNGRGASGDYGDGSFYQPFGATYEQSVGMEGTAAGSSGYGEGQFQATQSAVAQAAGEGTKAGKSAKGGQDFKGSQDRGVRNATKINKLTSSRGGSSFGGGTSGGARGGSYGGSNSTIGGTSGSADSTSRALPQAGPDQTNAEAFKFGRGGTMGGFNVGVNGGELKEGNRGGKGANNDLVRAAYYSAKAAKGSQSEGDKVLADAAFDGARPEEVPATVDTGAYVSDVLRGLGGDLDMKSPKSDVYKPIRDDVKDLAEKAEELTGLQNKLVNLQWITFGGALVFSIAISVLKSIPWLAGIVTGVAALLLTGMSLWMFNIFDQMVDPKFKDVSNFINPLEEKFSIIKTIALSGILVAAGWTNMWQKVWDNITSLFKGKGLAGAAEGAATAGESSGGIINWLKNFSFKTFGAIKGLLDKIFPSGGLFPKKK